MAKSTLNRQKTNFIIACGYCLLVIVIILNYFFKTGKGSNHKGKNRVAYPGQSVEKAGDELKSQLDEQRRINKEMRDFLIDIQRSKLPETIKLANSTSLKSMPKPSETQPLSGLSSYPVSLGLPEIDQSINGKFVKNASFPYALDKNLFEFPIVGAIVVNPETTSFPGQTIICSPKVPYVISGSNRNLRLISNY